MRSPVALQHLFTSHRAVIHKFSDKYDMVYFGRISRQDDDHRMIRGVTLTTNQIDQHYCVGTIQGYDTVLVERTARLQTFNTKKSEKYTWLIMQFDLRSATGLPHVFIDGKHHGRQFNQNISFKFQNLRAIDASTFDDVKHGFRDKFSVLSTSLAHDWAVQLLNGSVGEVLAVHFSQFDFEIERDLVYIYCKTQNPTTHLLEHMLRAGLWLANILDENAQKITSIDKLPEDATNSVLYD